VIAPVVTGKLGPGGWYRSRVQVSWQVSDSGSGIALLSGCGTTTLKRETTGVTLSCTATNGVGLSATQSLTVRIRGIEPDHDRDHDDDDDDDGGHDDHRGHNDDDDGWWR
jgi:hypothetical protein